MKRETIITAIVFLAVGFLAGYITDAQLNWNAQKRAASTPHVHDETTEGAAMPGAGGAGMGQGLPQGHPPIDTSAVVKTLEEQSAQNPNDPEPRLKFANYLYDQQQWQKAIEWYQKALELDPKNVSARTDLGTAYYNLGRPQDAMREYRKSLEADPNHQPTIFNSIVVQLDGTHDLAGARQAWERLNKMNPSYPGLDNMKKRLDAAGASGASSQAGR
ncbi:MAG: tetratricopeptide repeat protein [Terriglobia bacterium]